MPSRSDVRFRFWGVRGSIASPGAETARYGGNTPCLELRFGDRLVIVDGGTGMRGLGQTLLAQGGPVRADVVLSHVHWDHIQGIPFFTPAFIPGNEFRFWGERKGDRSLAEVLSSQMEGPTFPVPISIMRSTMTFRELSAAGTHDMDDGLRVRTAPMNHPNGCAGLRFEFDGRSIVYCTDTEHDPDTGVLDPAVLSLAQGADAFIYDAMFLEDAYRARCRGWGHSTFTEAIRLARAAQVKRLYFFHHDPSSTDAFLDERLAWARAETAGDDFEVLMAAEGPWQTL